MKKLNSKWMFSVALAAALMAGCGGGGGSVSSPPVSTDISQSVSALVTYLNELIAGTSDLGEPIDINGLTLATDDAAEPASLN